MNSTIRFGKLETITYDDTTTISVIETVHDFATTNTTKRYTQSVFGENQKHVLAEFLKLLDKLADDGISDIAFTCKKKQSKARYQMEVTWASK